MIPFVNVHSLNRLNVIQLTIKCHFDYEYDILNVTQKVSSTGTMGTVLRSTPRVKP